MKRSSLCLVPVTLKEAFRFIRLHHRHHRPPVGGYFAVGVSRGGEITGVAVVGRPVARALCDGWTSEVSRFCVLEDQRNACSMLYGACWRAAQAMG